MIIWVLTLCVCVSGALHAQEAEPSAESEISEFLETFLEEADTAATVVDPILSGAIASMEAGDNESAATELEDIILGAPGHLQALRLQVSCYLRLQDVERAITSCLQIAALDSLDTTAHTTLGYLHYASGNADNAELYFQLVLDDNPDAHLALSGLGWIYVDRRNMDAAHDVATRITEIAPEYAPNYVLLGRVLTVKGFYKEAARAYRRAFRLDASLRTQYGILLQELGQRHRLDR